MTMSREHTASPSRLINNVDDPSACRRPPRVYGSGFLVMRATGWSERMVSGRIARTTLYHSGWPALALAAILNGPTFVVTKTVTVVPSTVQDSIETPWRDAMSDARAHGSPATIPAAVSAPASAAASAAAEAR